MGRIQNRISMPCAAGRGAVAVGFVGLSGYCVGHFGTSWLWYLDAGTQVGDCVLQLFLGPEGAEPLVASGSPSGLVRSAQRTDWSLFSVAQRLSEVTLGLSHQMPIHDKRAIEATRRGQLFISDSSSLLLAPHFRDGKSLRRNT